jgi:hypothetical protein
MNTILFDTLRELIGIESEYARVRAEIDHLLEASHRIEDERDRVNCITAKLMREYKDNPVVDGPDDSRWELNGDRVRRRPRLDSRDVVLPPVEAEEEPEVANYDLHRGPTVFTPVGPVASNSANVFPALRLDSHGYYRDGRDGRANELAARARAGGAEISGGMT